MLTAEAEKRVRDMLSAVAEDARKRMDQLEKLLKQHCSVGHGDNQQTDLSGNVATLETTVKELREEVDSLSASQKDLLEKVESLSVEVSRLKSVKQK